jgi:hypothetical protein
VPDIYLTYAEATDLLNSAVLITIKTPNGNYIVDDCIEHRGPNRRTCISARNCVAAMTLYDKGDEHIGVRNGHRLHIQGQGELRLYKAFTE